MLNFIYVDGVLREINDEYVRGAVTRNDFRTFADAEKVAADAMAWNPGVVYLPVDSGASVSPRYDVILAPVVGMKVSKAFNGDYYPAGVITKISASMKVITTSTGVVFWRLRKSGTWLNHKTWSMVGGHISRRNPSF